MKSFDDVSVVGTGLPDNAKYDLVDNHGAELTCNMVTDLGTKVDDDGIALIRSSIMSELQSNFPMQLHSKETTLIINNVILDCLGEPKSSMREKNPLRTCTWCIIY